MPSPGKTSPCYIAESSSAPASAPLVAWLELPVAGGGTMIGGKAQRLGEMSRLGLPVPRGFCVTAAAYRGSVAWAGLDPVLDAARDLAVYDPRAAAAQAQAAIQRASFPPELEAAIVDSYGMLAPGWAPAAVAVRSSALGEDSAADSFAGVHSSFLDVAGERAVLDAVRRCWASFWSEAALAYRAARGVLEPIAGAVIVQEMIHADAAGVLFTADPVRGGRERLIAEAVAGIGERLVSGEVTPTRYELDRCGRLMSADRGPVSASFLYELATVALRIEEAFGQPQDIEWAERNGSLYVLQARPISTAPAPVAHPPDPATWTRQSIGERFPDPLMPLEATFVASWVFAPGFRRLFQSMGAPPELAEQVFATFGGLAYLNRGLLADLLKGIPREQALRIADGAADLSGAPARPSLALARTGLRLFRIIRKRHREFARQAPGFGERCRRMRNRTFEGRTAADLGEELAAFRALISEMSRGHLESIAAAEILMSLAVLLTARWAPGVKAGRVRLLFTGHPENRTLAMNRRFAALVDAARECATISDVLTGDEPASVLPRLRELANTSVKTAEFLGSFGRFLDEFGHRTANYSLSHPRWREEPVQAIRLVQSRLQFPPAPPAGLCRDRELASVLKAVPLWKRLFLRPVLRLAWIYCGALRENENHYITMPFPDLKRLLAAIAERLRADGRLRETADLYFLTMRELEESRVPDRAAIAARRREHRAALAARRELPASPSGGPSGGTLRGTPASPGEVSGRARLLREPAGRLEPGEILVTRMLNAAWAPVLPLAAGVVTDIGGMLSHGAVIARELGVPAVVGVDGATSTIRDGQLLTVCGTRGTVRIEYGEDNV